MSAEHQPSAVDAAQFRAALRQHGAGVVIVTMDAGSGPVGFTATSLSSASADPPLVVFNVARTASSARSVHEAATVLVHVLGADHAHLARRFATSGIDRFAPPTAWHALPTGEPLLEDAPTWLRATVEQRLPVGDHTLVVARVVEVHVSPAAPLLYHDGGYHRPVELEPPADA